MSDNIDKPITCHSCSKELDLTKDSKISRQEECPHCMTSLHCCKMCKFFDPTSYNDCKEPMAPRVVDKEKANYCDFYRITSPESSAKTSKEDLLSAADALFKK